MEAFLDSQLLGKNNSSTTSISDRVTEEERSCLSSVVDDQSYQVVQHLINKLGESREKEELIRKDFALFQKWMKKISIDDLVRDMEGIISENSQLIAELNSTKAASREAGEKVEQLKTENYELKLKLLASAEYGGDTAPSPNSNRSGGKKADNRTDSTHSSSSHAYSSDDEGPSYSQASRSVHSRHRELPRRHQRSRDSSRSEIKELQHMLEDAVEEKHNMKLQMNKLQQELSLKNIAVEEGRSLRSEVESVRRELKVLRKARDDIAKKESRALAQIRKLEAMLDEAIDEFDNLEVLYEKKSNEFDALSKEHSVLKKSSGGGGALAACCVDGGICKNEEELKRIRQDVQKRKEAERSDKESVELLLGEMGAEVDAMRDFAQAAITEKLLIERKLKQLDAIASKCSCSSGSLRNILSNKTGYTGESNRSMSTRGSRTVGGGGLYDSFRTAELSGLQYVGDESPLVSQARDILTSVFDTMQSESHSVDGGEDRLAKLKRSNSSTKSFLPSTIDFFDLDQELSGRKPRMPRPPFTQSLTVEKGGKLLDSASSRALLPVVSRRHSFGN